MGKSHRGHVQGAFARTARGTCPICSTAAIKLFYPLTVNGEQLKVCKRCRKKTAA